MFNQYWHCSTYIHKGTLITPFGEIVMSYNTNRADICPKYVTHRHRETRQPDHVRSHLK